MKIPVIMDMDPGHDDVIALFLAAGHPDMDVRAVTTVSGNADIGKTTRNALVAVDTAGLNKVPVAEGAARPLIRMPEHAPSIHGESGLDGPELPVPTHMVEEKHAVDVMEEILLQSEEEITVIATGPLTNLAMLCRKNPKAAGRIRHLSIMGGGTFGNWTPAAEFNIYADAEAAEIVFASGIPITMCGLDVTHQALSSGAVVQRIKEIPTMAAQFTYELLDHFQRAYEERFQLALPPVHDPCAVAVCLQPSLFTFESAEVKVETAGKHTYGETVIDASVAEGPVQVAVEVNNDKFWDLIVQSLKNLP